MKTQIDVKQIMRELSGLGRIEQPLTPFARSFQRAALHAMHIGVRRGRKTKEANKPVYDVNGRRVNPEEKVT